MFNEITAKLGNMKKAQEFVVYPFKKGAAELIIQSDKRIAQVNLETGKTILSDGKGEHPGFVKLSSFFGAVEVDTPPELLEWLRKMAA